MLTHPLIHENFNQNCPTTFSIDRLSDGWNFLPTLNFLPLNFLPTLNVAVRARLDPLET